MGNDQAGLQYQQLSMRGRDKKEKKYQCQVCFLMLFQGEYMQRLQCIVCQRSVHRYCYSPEIKDKSKFKCDECRFKAKNKDYRLQCLVCGKDQQRGMLKDAGNSNWLHVLCGLQTNKVELQAYKNLIFYSQEQINSKNIPKAQRCIRCNYDKHPGSKCFIEGCLQVRHISCALQQQMINSEEDFYTFLTIGLIDKNEDSLLNHILKFQDVSEKFKGLQLLNKVQKEIKFFVCQRHCEYGQEFFVWCYCGKAKDNSTAKYSQCEKCKRWQHGECSNLSKQFCRGCSTADIYKKNVSLSQMIGKLIEIQNTTQFDKSHIRFLDHVPLKLSISMIKSIYANHFQIERYYLRKCLEANFPQQTQGISKLEIIYYLHKRERKNESEIQPSEISEILSSGNKYQWSQDKSSQVQKKYKHFLQFKLKALEKDDSRELKTKLQAFIKATRYSIRTQATIAQDIFDVIKSLDNTSSWKQSYTKVKSDKIQEQLLQLFYQLHFGKEEVEDFIKVLRKIFSARSKQVICEVDLKQIKRIISKCDKSSKRTLLKQVADSLLKKVSLRNGYKEKKHLKIMLENRYKESKLESDRQNIKKQLLDNQILLQKNSIIFQMQKDLIDISVLKRIILRKYSNPKHFELEQIRTYISKLLQINKKTQSLSSSQLTNFQQLLHKTIFYDNIYKAYQLFSKRNEEFQNSSSMIDEQMQMEVEQKQNKMLIKPKSIKQEIAASLMDWNFQEKQSLIIGLTQLDKLARFNVGFEKTELQIIEKFAISIISCIMQQLDITGDMLFRMNKVIVYLHLHQRFDHLITLYQEYKSWKQQLQENFPKINVVLEVPKQSSELLCVIQRMIETGDDLQIDVRSQIKKLKTIRFWILLSQKLHSEHKATITAVQHTKNLMDKIRYPANSLRSTIERLQSQSKSLNKRINHFLEKPKSSEMEIYQQLKFIQSKMTVSDGEQLREDLTNSQLDVQVELQELIQELNQFKKIPKNIKKQIESLRSYDQLMALKKRILQSAFKIQNLDDYQQLVIKIISVKCQNLQQGAMMSKKQFFTYINYAGQAGINLQNRMTHAAKIYMEIQKAERQILGLRPRQEYLLNSFDYKRFKNELRFDANQLQKIQKWFSSNEKLKQKYRSNRGKKIELSQLIILESQLLKIPINNREILNELNKIKKDILDIELAAKLYLKDFGDPTVQYQNPYLIKLVEKYRSNGIRSNYLESIDKLYNDNVRINDMAKVLKEEDYKNFIDLCDSHVPFQKNDEVYQLRERLFFEMAQKYNESKDPMSEVGYSLLEEGGFLLKRPRNCERVLTMLVQIHEKFNKWEGQPCGIKVIKKDWSSSNEQRKSSEEDDIQDEQGDVNSDSLQDQDEQQKEYNSQQDMDDEDDFQDQDESSSKNKKRGRPAGQKQIVQLDDD